MDLDFGEDFQELSQRLRAEEYQDQLDTLTQEYYQTLNELIEARAQISAKKSAIILQAKKGIMITKQVIVRTEGGFEVKEEDGEELFKASNEEERESLLEHFLGSEYRKEKNLLDKIKYYDLACKNVRQMLSAEQSKMSVDKVVAQALGTGQL